MQSTAQRVAQGKAEGQDVVTRYGNAIVRVEVQQTGIGRESQLHHAPTWCAATIRFPESHAAKGSYRA